MPPIAVVSVRLPQQDVVHDGVAGHHHLVDVNAFHSLVLLDSLKTTTLVDVTVTQQFWEQHVLL